MITAQEVAGLNPAAVTKVHPKGGLFCLNLLFIKNMADYIYDKEYNEIIHSQYEITHKEYENCVFNRCDFTNCNFMGVNFVDCIFNFCNFKEAKIGHVGLRNVMFNDCDFTSVNFAMTDQIIYEFNFKNCKLDYVQFYDLKLRNMTFTNCSLISADFMQSDITEALFDNCNLHLTVFDKAIANKADFYSSYFFSIDPEKTKLKKAIFSQDGLKGLLHKYEIIVK